MQIKSPKSGIHQDAIILIPYLLELQSQLSHEYSPM
ncbi:hypothetical protein DR94_80 [Proteus mirabilis]|nr:hypothetical protein DR94_80 [Proteus mirabilis]